MAIGRRRCDEQLLDSVCIWIHPRRCSGDACRVLVLSADGQLESHKPDGRVILLATGIMWPLAKWKDEQVLCAHVPKWWGKQNGSECVLKGFPIRIYRYEDDFVNDKIDNPAALDGMSLICIDQAPRGVMMMFLHEMPIPFNECSRLDRAGLDAFEAKRLESRKKQEKRAIAAVELMLEAEKIEKAEVP